MTLYFPHDEERRPGLTAIIDKVKTANPKWNDIQVRLEAKLLWHKANPGTNIINGIQV